MSWWDTIVSVVTGSTPTITPNIPATSTTGYTNYNRGDNSIIYYNTPVGGEAIYQNVGKSLPIETFYEMTE